MCIRDRRSEGKATWPGRKQVFRQYGTSGQMEGDTITAWGADQAGQPLLEAVLRQGKRVRPTEPLSKIRERSVRDRERLPEYLRVLENNTPYPIRIAPALEDLAKQADEAITRRREFFE